MALMMAAAAAGRAGVAAEVWREGKLSLALDDGKAELEWLSSAAFRFSRSWGAAPLEAAVIKHDPVLIAREDTRERIRMRSRYLVVELDEGVNRVEVRANDTPLVTAAVFDAMEPELRLTPPGKTYGGFSPGRGGFFFSNNGYGVERFAPAAHSIQVALYYGPTPKEIFEQRQIAAGQKEVTHEALSVLNRSQLPKEATPLPNSPLDSWEKFGKLARLLQEMSLAAVRYPAFDLRATAEAPPEVKQRALDLAAVLPIVYRTDNRSAVDRATRAAFTPYLITYLREAFDRGFPLIRPLPMQFPRDANADTLADVFMLGDEFLLAPVTGPGERRRLTLPRGLWTDLRTNMEYRGNQTIEIDAPAGRVPMFTRNGSLFPLAAGNRMELHYVPALGGEFFLWEPGLQDNSQFHAAPAADYLRVEVETKIERTYEWVVHHTPAAAEVAEDSRVYRRVNTRGELRDGSWWHDAQRNNLHILLRAEAGPDRIINVSFPMK
jgi:hypothetical protein